MTAAQRLGANIARLRKQARLSQEALGLDAAIHPTQISRLEGAKNNPTLATLTKLANGLSVDIDALLAPVGDEH